MKYDNSEIEKVKTTADIRLIIPGANQRKTSQDVDCPFCGKKKKLHISVKKGYNNAYCFACNKGFANPLEAYAHYNQLSVARDFVKCLEGTARDCGVIILPVGQRRKEILKQTTDSIKQSFCATQLESSGLCVDDVMATVVEGDQEYTRCPFQPGTFGQNFSVDLKGNDMLINYYDLYGRPVKYVKKGSSTQRNYIRARFANPDAHLSAEGAPMKYQTPSGAPTQVYVPEKIRRMFKAKSHIEVLFLQEGEKKAEKACKHGMPSLGIQGIMNIGSKEMGLIQAVQDVVSTCSVRHIVLVMDSDWAELSKSIKTGDRADGRPNSFASAVIKFKKYVETFHNLGLNVDIWWAHVNVNKHGDKGVDDLLVGALFGRESDLMADVERTMYTHDGKGEWLDVHKITTLSDAKIRDFWHLNDHKAFYNAHSTRLKEIPTFKIGAVRYKVEEDALVPVCRYSSDADIFTVEIDSKERKKVTLSYTETLRFLSASGFSRIKNSDDVDCGFSYIRIDDGIIDKSAPYEMRDFILDYIQKNTNSALVLEYFNDKLDSILADKKLERLPIIEDNFNAFEPGIQRTYYNNGQVEISSQSITPGLPISNVWRKRLVPRNFKRIPIIQSITKCGDRFNIELTNDGEKCEFLKFIINTSNNYYTPSSAREVNDDERAEWTQHIVNKITAIGYLLADWKYTSDRQAVVIQDHLISEVGQAWGGAGKSVLGTAIGKIVHQFFINGKEFSATDEFALSGVTKATRNIFIDDIKTNFNFKDLFNWVTGPMPINPKGAARYTINAEDSPKILITTNHAIKGAEEGSVKRRIAYMEFSSWYNQDHSIIEDFHHMFFDDWDEYQWALFDNFMAECVMYYLRSFELLWHREGRGVVPPPMKNIELRTLRQSMSEVFFQWAEEFYDPAGSNLNKRIPRVEIFRKFIEYAGTSQIHGVTQSNIKRRIITYCKYKGYDFNKDKPIDNKAEAQVYYSDWKPSHPNEPFIGSFDKSGGTEYLTVYSDEKDKENYPF